LGCFFVPVASGALPSMSAYVMGLPGRWT